MVSKMSARRGVALLAAVLAVFCLALAPGVTHARSPKKSNRYGIMGQFVSYDEAQQVFKVLVTSRKAKIGSQSTVGDEAPKDIEPRKERDFAVAPEGSVLSRTVIKSVEGTGVDKTGTQEGFRKAVNVIPTDRPVAFSIEKNADHKTDSNAPEYRIKTLIIVMTEEEIQRRLKEFLESE